MTPNVNSFASFDLTKEEYIAGCMLSTNQKAVIQNIIAETAEEKINLVFDPLNPVKFAQQEADLAGKIAILRYLLDLSQSAELSTLELPEQ